MGVREVIEIDEKLCDGCGDCVTACAEGAIAIIDGKARLISDVYCDGLGACLGHCPQGALKVIHREADAFDEQAVEDHLAQLKEKNSRAAAPQMMAVVSPAADDEGRRLPRFEGTDAPAGLSSSIVGRWRPLVPASPLAGPTPPGAADGAVLPEPGCSAGGRLCGVCGRGFPSAVSQPVHPSRLPVPSWTAIRKSTSRSWWR